MCDSGANCAPRDQLHAYGFPSLPISEGESRNKVLEIRQSQDDGPMDRRAQGKKQEAPTTAASALVSPAVPSLSWSVGVLSPAQPMSSRERTRSVRESGFPGGSMLKNPPGSAGGAGSILGLKTPEPGVATHSSTLAWRGPRTEEPGCSRGLHG